jgi:hypothetical protein
MGQAAASEQNNEAGVNTSEFAMWRAVFAFAYVDNSLSLEEQEILNSYLAKAPFSKVQRILLKDDMMNPKDVTTFYKQITHPEDKTRFCVLARAIAWCEGAISAQEKYILKKMSCFGEVVDEEILRKTRGHPHIETYYHQYAKSGMMGLFRTPHLIEIRV